MLYLGDILEGQSLSFLKYYSYNPPCYPCILKPFAFVLVDWEVSTLHSLEDDLGYIFKVTVSGLAYKITQRQGLAGLLAEGLEVRAVLQRHLGLVLVVHLLVLLAWP